MAKPEVRMNDAGTVIEMQIRRYDDTLYPISDTEILQYKFQKPDGTVIVRNATAQPDSIAQYITAEDDFDQIGMWLYQV